MYDDDDSDVFMGTDEDGKKIDLKIERYFFYNGDKYVLLQENNGTNDADAGDDSDQKLTLYVMRVEDMVSDDGEVSEEFIPVDEDLMETLIQVIQTKFESEDDEITEELNDN